jgi:hypothetical protein
VQVRYKPIAIVAVLLGVLGVVGYLTPASTEQVPTRFLFENAGGKVIFNHKAHTEGYRIPCQECHHESDKPSQRPVACAACHAASFEEGFLAEHQKNIGEEYCVRCHHSELGRSKFDHEGHKGLTSGCLDCHHDRSVEPEPTSCGKCHQAQGKENMPSLRDATHKRCADCHDEFFAKKVKGCTSCHAMTENGTQYPGCFSCHFDSKKLPIPGKMEAYHAACMQCHKKKGAGPYTPEDCNKCHFR